MFIKSEWLLIVFYYIIDFSVYFVRMYGCVCMDVGEGLVEDFIDNLIFGLIYI